MEKYKERFSKYEKNRWTGLTISLCIVVVFYMIVSNIGNLKGFFDSFFAITSTVIIGGVIAYMANPFACIIYKRAAKNVNEKNQNRVWVLSAVLSLTTMLAIIVALIALITPRLIENITAFARGLTGYIDSFKQLVINSELDEKYQISILGFVDEQTDVATLVSKVFGGNEITPAWVLSFSAGIGSKAFGFMIGVILAYYFLCAKKKLLDTLGEFFYLVIPSSHYADWSNICNRLNSIFSRFIVCEFVDALIVGIVNAIFMFATGMPYAVICSVVVAITNLAPTFGPFVGAFIAAVILLLAKPDSVIPFLIFTLILQLIDGYVIKPRLFGSALNVPSFLVLVFLVVGGKIWGVPGVLLAIPLAAILTYIYTEIVVPWLKSRKRVKDEAAKMADSKTRKVHNDGKAG